MSTHSTIAVKLTDGSVNLIYCHSDGYIESVGAKLLTHYNTYEKVLELILLGDISSLGENSSNTFAYHRDREEDLNIFYYPAIELYFKEEHNKGILEGYNYIFIDGEWWVQYWNNLKHTKLVDACKKDIPEIAKPCILNNIKIIQEYLKDPDAIEVTKKVKFSATRNRYYNHLLSHMTFTFYAYNNNEDWKEEIYKITGERWNSGAFSNIQIIDVEFDESGNLI